MRGITPADAEAFLHPDIACLDDPMKLRDMPAAVERIQRAIDAHEKIAVYGAFWSTTCGPGALIVWGTSLTGWRRATA